MEQFVSFNATKSFFKCLLICIAACDRVADPLTCRKLRHRQLRHLHLKEFRLYVTSDSRWRTAATYAIAGSFQRPTPDLKPPERGRAVRNNTLNKQKLMRRTRSSTYAPGSPLLILRIATQPLRSSFCYPRPPIRHQSNLTSVYPVFALHLFRYKHPSSHT